MFLLRLRALTVTVVTLAAFFTATASAQETLPAGARETDQVVMDDGFQYRLVDFGLGNLGWAVRHTAVPPDAPSKVFWYIVEVTNLSQQDGARPKYVCSLPSFTGPCQLADSAGKRHFTAPVFADIANPGAYDPTPKEYKDYAGDYKPGDRKYFVRYCNAKDFAPGTQSLSVSMGEQADFLLPNPLERKRNLDTRATFKSQPNKPETWPPKVLLVSKEPGQQP